jgi:glycosylphosphatidylinositol transamidase (GPIT) subunit GPI8
VEALLFALLLQIWDLSSFEGAKAAFEQTILYNLMVRMSRFWMNYHKTNYTEEKRALLTGALQPARIAWN